MPISVQCPACSAKLNAPNAAAGKRVKCLKCSGVLTVPVPAVKYEVVEDNPPTPDRRKPPPAADDEPPRPTKKPIRARPESAPIELESAPIELDAGDNEDEVPKPKRRRGTDTTPRGKGKRRSHLPLLLGVGVLALLTVIGIVVGVVVAGGGGQAKVTTAPSDLPPRPLFTLPSSPALPSSEGGTPSVAAANAQLREIGLYNAVPIPETPLDTLVYFEEVDPYADERPVYGTGLLRQELYRQGVLLAAREELGLTTRDAALGEPPPDGLPAAQRLRVIVRLPHVLPPREVRVETGAADKPRTVWAVSSKETFDENVLTALGTADGLTRGGFVTALRRVGGWKDAPRPRTDKRLPAAAVTALERPSVVSQLAAVRELHATVREAGESPAALAALSRGYANLGLLTDSQWDGSTWVFKARSLLYAERLRQLDPSAPLGWWARGYALALAGRHGDALKDFVEAERVGGGKGTPEWVPLAVGLCKFDTRDLGERAMNGSLADTALLFQYLTTEGGSSASGRSLGAEFLKRYPLCHRVANSMARTGELGPRRAFSVGGLEAMRVGYRDELERVSGLPREAFRLVQDEGQLDELLEVLEAAGREAKDRTELSWAVAARVARESRFTLIDARLSFLHYTLAVPADDYLAEVRPLVAGHPLAPVLEAYSTELNRQPDAMRKVLRKPPVAWYTTRQENRRIHTRFLSQTDFDSMHNLALRHADGLYTDLALMLKPLVKPAEKTPYARMLLEASPFSPLARATLVGSDWEGVRANADQWEKECQHPVLTMILARRAVNEKRTKDAERLLLKTLEFGKDLAASALLADLYLAQGDEDHWRTILEEALEAPAEGLEHARVQVKLALHYAGKKDFATARKYAEPAAETWAAWAMLCASYCAEGDGDYQASELWMRRTAERYDDQLQAWYYWCLRTGRGDLARARALVERHLKAVGTPKVERDRMLSVLLLLIDDKPKEAATILEAVFKAQKDGFYLMLAAAAWDRAGDTGERDRLLKALPSASDYSPLAKLLVETAAKGDKVAPDEKRLDELIQGAVPGLRPNLAFFAAEFLRQRGQREASNRFYKAAQERAPPLAIGPPLAGVALRAE